MKYIVSILIAFMLVGCGASTIQSLKEKNISRTFVLDMNYQKYHRKTLPMLKQCIEFTGIGASMIVEGELYTDIKESRITQSMQAFGNDYWTLIYGKGIGEKTEITIYSKSERWTNDFYEFIVEKKKCGE